MLIGKHLIAGEWVDGHDTFQSFLADGEKCTFSRGTPALANLACQAAEEAFVQFGSSPREDRIRLLNAIAAELDERASDVIRMAHRECGLPVTRLQGELKRTTGQLRVFAEHISDGRYLDRRTTSALPDRKPVPRPDLRLMMRPIGPVVVFGASNFPLAFSTAGGDTASALAAGCPVIVKGHPAHPGTSDVVAQAILAAIRSSGAHVGVFSLIQDDSHAVARALLQHPLIAAVGFTGSLAAGRTLFELCASRPEPIPFFGELGSINPSFVLPGALQRRGTEIARGWAESLVLGAGQFCTNPGVIFLPDCETADRFSESAQSVLADVGAQTMLTNGIAESFRAGVARLDAISGVSKRIGEKSAGQTATPWLFETSSQIWRSNPELSDEVFGPVGTIVRTSSVNEFVELSQLLCGQLTATLHIDDIDEALAANLLPLLERKAGRLLVNDYPTGVEVDKAMMHGGPYPATTNSAATSVGTLSIRRFLRPVCYQNMPESLLPPELRGAAND